ncbi:MAG TPA: rhamnogalacturonan acetylesterase [Pyrinomonadaceae bacterium]|nr:rhamnogalacturonan acetylesterase [Pyrinomonadaceae bacterium]
MKLKKAFTIFFFTAVFSCLIFAQKAEKPTLFLVGDSTVNNSSESFQGWGNVIGEYFDKSKINVVNKARGGRSSRTFYTEGLWKEVVNELKSGDFVLIQFGHNDGGAIDKEKFRGSIRGIGEEKQEIIGQDGKPETVRTFGWYLRKFISDAKEKGASVVLLSPVPRNQWKDGKVKRENEAYGKWSRETAEKEKVFFVDLNEITAQKYEKIGAETVGKEYFTTKDNTHTSPLGAKINAESVVEGLKKLKKFSLRKFVLKK